MATKIRRFTYSFGCLLVALCWGSGLAQTSGPSIRILDSEEPTFQQDLARLGADGYEIALRRPGAYIMQRHPQAAPRTYSLVADVAQMPRDRSNTSYRILPFDLEPGYRPVPRTFTFSGETFFSAFERIEGDEQRKRNYIFVGTSSDEYLDELGLIRGANWTDLEAGLRAIENTLPLSPVVLSDRGVAAIFEHKDVSEPWKILATSRTATMAEELAAAAAEGYRIVDGAGGTELAYALVKAADAPPVEYRLLATTRSSTLERELNEAAHQGFRFVASSLAALQGGQSLFRPRPTNETVAVMEKAAAPPVTYLVLGTRRESTLQKELLQAGSKGFSIAAGIAGFEEVVVVLERVDTE